MKQITDNRRARFDYFIEDKYEAGMELEGWEVKSARAGSVTLAESFVAFTNGQCFLKNASFSPYNFGDVTAQNPRRDRRLLLKKSEIAKLSMAVAAKGYTVVATQIYFNKDGRIKIEIALARGKHTFDKKQTLKERDIARETRAAIHA